jgi:hypothetical protein
MQDIQKLQISMLVESDKTKSSFCISYFPVATHGHSTSHNNDLIFRFFVGIYLQAADIFPFPVCTNSGQTAMIIKV